MPEEFGYIGLWLKGTSEHNKSLHISERRPGMLLNPEEFEADILLL